MKKCDLIKAFEIIAEAEERGCGVVEMKVGYVDKDNILHKGLVITKCPPIILEVLMSAGYMLGAGQGGVVVTKIS